MSLGDFSGVLCREFFTFANPLARRRQQPGGHGLETYVIKH
jgi:hypothetical protein